jgi:hypothetical protein
MTTRDERQAVAIEFARDELERAKARDLAVDTELEAADQDFARARDRLQAAHEAAKMRHVLWAEGLLDDLLNPLSDQDGTV